MGYAIEATGERPLRLAEVDPAGAAAIGEEEAAARLEELTAELRELQELMFAAEEHGALVVLQGMDAAGKDITIASVFAAATPEACRVKAFKRETSDEVVKRDFLWRAHHEVPKRGEVVVFDRSYYEQVVTEWVEGEVDDERVRRRFDHVRHFEELLADDGRTILLKFFLHVGPDEQKRRLEEREADPRTAWKTSARDWTSRQQWDDYMAAYEAAINATATPAIPWYVVPADRQWFHTLAVAEALVDRLRPHREAWLAARERIGAEERRAARAARGKE
jgi:PPK2 family polyphosphate:nucleotide phosphotransferase